MKKLGLWCVVLAVLMTIASACGTDDDKCSGVDCGSHGTCNPDSGTCVCDEGFQLQDDQCLAELEIIGDWVDDWGGNHSISQTSWENDGSIFTISQYDNQLGYLVAQNDSNNEWSPDLWSRFDWTWDADDQLYYCQIAYDAADEATALGNSAADRSDLSTGCSGFAWSTLSAQ